MLWTVRQLEQESSWDCMLKPDQQNTDRLQERNCESGLCSIERAENLVGPKVKRGNKDSFVVSSSTLDVRIAQGQGQHLQPKLSGKGQSLTHTQHICNQPSKGRSGGENRRTARSETDSESQGRTLRCDTEPSYQAGRVSYPPFPSCTLSLHSYFSFI